MHGPMNIKHALLFVRYDERLRKKLTILAQQSSLVNFKPTKAYWLRDAPIV